MYEVIHKGTAPTRHTGKKDQFPQRHWHPASWRLKNKRWEFIVRFRFVQRALPGLGPTGTGELGRKPARRQGHLSSLVGFQNTRSGFGPKAECPSEGGHIWDPSCGGDGQNPALQQVLLVQEAQPLWVMPANKQDT